MVPSTGELMRKWPHLIKVKVLLHHDTHRAIFSEKRLTSNEEIIAETEAYFGEFDKSYFLDGLKTSKYRWTKVYRTKRKLCREKNRIRVLIIQPSYIGVYHQKENV